MEKDKNKKILIVEDDPILTKNIMEILKEEGFIVRAESDGDEGIKAANEYMPDLILCDISIPTKNGYEVLKEILNSDKTKDIPFIFLTAKVERQDIRKGMQLGADDYIFKPFDMDDLLNSIKLRLRKSKNKTEDKSGESKNIKKIYEMTDKVTIKIGRKMFLYIIKDLKFLKAKNPYVLLKFADGRNSLQRQTLSEWESKLPSKYFIRIHRSTIINSEFILKIEKVNKTSYTILLKDEEEPFVISKRFNAKVMERIP